MNFNKLIIGGRLTRDPELRYTPKGSAIAKLGLAVNRKWKTESGEEREEALFVDVDAFGRTAEVIGQHMKKGREILVEGRLKLDTWDDKNTGQKRSRLGVVLESFQFVGSGERQERPATQAAAPAPRVAAEDVPGVDADGSDVPF
jgi:single-strand DNA-binding protein